jgi:hypothetical protein
VQSTTITETARLTWKAFLESSPPTTQSGIGDLYTNATTLKGQRLSRPELTLFCTFCEGDRIFHCLTDNECIPNPHFRDQFLVYRCRNCNRASKTYAVAVRGYLGATLGEAIKYGEWPAFGPRVPNKVLKLFEEDRELFLKGRRAENQGMGIAAFAYYRRVVENKRSVLIGKIVEVAERIGADTAVVQQLRTAKESWQFTRSIEPIKNIIPERLKIAGHNPLVLLHKALSEGLHEESDEHCLELATSIRVVITELAERLAEALKDDADLKAAINRIASRPRTNNPADPAES